MSDYQKVYDEFWRDIVEPDGVLDLEQVKKELHDYGLLMERVSKVYDHITGGLLSKCHYSPELVIAAADDHIDDVCKDAIKEAVEQAIYEHEAGEDM